MNVEDFFILRFTAANTRRAHRYKLFYPLVKLMQGISVLAIRVWNSLPNCVDFNSLGAFKGSLTSQVLANFCKVHFI